MRAQLRLDEVRTAGEQAWVYSTGEVSGRLRGLALGFLAEYQIEFYALSGVVGGGLVAGKVVVVLDHTPVGHRFAADHRPGLAALYKTIIYMAVAFVVVAGERLFHAYREHDGLASAITAIWENRDWSLILAKVLCVGLAFLGYHLFVAADSRLGKGTLWRALWARR